MHKEITFALTSCGRPDLLEKTIDSFLEFNHYPIKRFKIIDDSAIKGINDHLIEKYPDIEWVHNSKQLGQAASIDILYSDIETEYIFHCEDDWEFIKHGFIGKSMEILESDKSIIQVWLRGRSDTNGHPLIQLKDFDYDVVAYGYQGIWHGFSFNPGLRRLHDYLLVKPYSSIGWETELNHAYKTLGFKAVSLQEQHVKHTGWGRHMQDAKG
jgi:hypothetical protein